MPFRSALTGSVRRRQQRLLDENAAVLRQALDLLQHAGDGEYRNPGLSGIAAGPQFRHVLDFYDCFFRGLAGGLIDYDARTRNPLLETSAAEGRRAIERVLEKLERTPELLADETVWVRAEAAEPGEPLLQSSRGRELQTLLGHTIHHFALIAVAFREAGIAVPSDFGVAPATLLHRERLRVEAA